MAPNTMSNSDGEVGTAEVYFAKKLANNDKKVRDKTLKKLKTWLLTRSKSSAGLDETELLKIWKGLFYCMWFSDKPLVQEELVDNLGSVVHIFKTSSPYTGVLFSNVFTKTIGREWIGIDRLRLDKFYLLIKCMIKETLKYLQSTQWNKDLVKCYSTFNTHCLLEEKFPDSLKIYFSEHIFSHFLTLEDIQDINEDTIMLLLEPFLSCVAYTISNSVLHAVVNNILVKLNEPQDNIKIPYQALADRLCTLGAKQNVKTKNRKILFKYTDIYRETMLRNETKQAKTKKKKRKKKAANNDSIENGEPEKKKKISNEEENSDKKIKKKKKILEKNVENLVEGEKKKKRKKKKLLRPKLETPVKETENTEEPDNNNETEKVVDEKPTDKVVEEQNTVKTEEKPVNDNIEPTESCEPLKQIESTETNSVVDSEPEKISDKDSSDDVKDTFDNKNKENTNNDVDFEIVTDVVKQKLVFECENESKDQKTTEKETNDTDNKETASKDVESDTQISEEKLTKIAEKIDSESQCSDVTESVNTEESCEEPLKTPSKKNKKETPEMVKQRRKSLRSGKKAPKPKSPAVQVIEESLKTPQTAKKIRIDLTKNKAIGHKDLKISPLPAFIPSKQPNKSALKRYPTRARSKAADFF